MIIYLIENSVNHKIYIGQTDSLILSEPNLTLTELALKYSTTTNIIKRIRKNSIGSY